MMKLPITIILACVQLVSSFQFASLVVSASDKTINANTQYTVYYDRTKNDNFGTTAYATSPITPSDTLTLTFPASYALTSVTCLLSINGGTEFVPSACSISGNKVTATGIVGTNTFVETATFKVSNVVNPYPAILTNYFIGTIGSDTSGTGFFSSQIQLEPDEFTSCYATFSPSTVNSTGAMVFTIVPKNAIGTSGTIVIQFPSTRRWSNDLSTTNLFPITTSMACTNYSANVKSSLTCAGDSSAVTVTASNLFSSSNSNSFSFAINSFLSPPTNEPADQLTLYSQINGNQIDSCSFYVSDLTPKSLTSISLTSSTGAAMVVNALYTIRFTFTLTDTLSQTDTITVAFPAGTTMVFSTGTIVSNFGINPSASSYDEDSRTLTLSMTNQGRTFSRGSSVQFQVGSYKAPPSISPTSAFTLTIWKNNYPKMSGTATITATTSTLSGSASALATSVNANTSYTFSLTISDPITSAGKIKIVLPPSITILFTSASCATVSGTNMAVTPSCAINAAENSITLSSLNSSASDIGAQTATITIAGLQNPPSTAPTASFTVYTYYLPTDASMVAIGSISGITATIASISSSNVLITPSSTQVNAVSVDYKLQLKVVNPIPIGGHFSIYIPPQIGVDVAAASSHCSININSTSFVATSCTAATSGTGHIINFTNPLSTDATVNTVLVAQVQQIFTNPVSTKPTASFQILTYHSNGYSISSITSAVSVTMDTAASFLNSTLTRDNSQNYGLAVYSISLTQFSPFQPSSFIYIGFPSDVVPSSSSACSLVQPSSLAGPLSCTLTGSTLKIPLPASTIASSTSITLTISAVRNPPSFKPCGSFTVQTKTANDLYRYCYGILSPGLTNSIASIFEALSYVFTPTILGEATVLKVTFNPSDSTVIPSSMRLSFADSFTITSPTCNTFVDFTGSCAVVAANTIGVTGSFTASSMSFSIAGITSPSAAPSDYSSLLTFDSSGYKIDESNRTILFSLDCTLPCRTCSSKTAPTECLSCYSLTSSISTFVYLDTTLKTCNEECVDGKYENTATMTCSACNSNCATCTGSPTFCDTCKKNTTFIYLYKLPTSQTCVADCPETMYPDAALDPTTCAPCVSPCQTCTLADSCTSCVDGTFLYLTKCDSGCPSGIAVENPTTNECDLCDPNCLTCSVATTTCTSCTQGLLLYLSQCLTECPSPLVPQNGTCGPCDSNCKTCKNDPFTCTSCDTASALAYLYQSKCLSVCPDLYYENLGEGVCSLCSSVSGLNCSNCSTASTCLSCNTGYVLHQSSCLNYVPTGFVNISGVAVACQGDCATCSLSTTNCTSCTANNLLSNQCLATCPTGYVAISKICEPCSSPCKTCAVATDSCTSCLTNLTPEVFLSSNECLQNCPDSTFANIATNKCTNCVSPCEYCTSLTSCLTCATGFYLEGTNCVTTCQSGFTGVDRVCQQCVGNCATCQNETTLCLSCKTGTYLFSLNNSCVTDCGVGLFVDSLTRTCIYCTDPCKTCTNTTDTCLSCLTGVLYENVCLDQCPGKFFNQSNKCSACPANCSSCTGLNTCTTCIDTFVLYTGFCITSCPSTHAIVINSVCTACSGLSCHTCNSADVCDSCQSGYSLLNGNCLGNCPSGYQTNGTHCIDTNIQVLTTNSDFPVPFTIAAIVVIVACLMSRLQFNHTFMPGAIFAFLGVIEWAALAFFIYLYWDNFFSKAPLPLFVGIAALLYLYILNILALVAQNIVFCADKHFSQWYSVGTNKGCTIFTNVVSTLCCHKFRNVLFCKLFTFGIFTAQLDSVSKFKILNIFAFLSLLHSAAAVFAAAAAIPYTTSFTQPYYACVDVIVVTSINAILAFFNVMKPRDFFYERTPDGFDLKKKIKGEDDYFEDKIEPAGKDNEDEQGFYSNNVIHVKGGMTTQPFRFNQSDEASDQDYSYGSLVDKQYEEVSVQALELINEHEKDPSRTFDITRIDAAEEANSNYTVFFKNSDKNVGRTIDAISDKGVQNTIDDGLESIKPNVTNKSIQPSERRFADQSAQRFSSLEPVDRSAQRTIFFQEDESMQYAESMSPKKPSLKNQSVQNAVSTSSKNIMYRPEMVARSNQKSTIERADEGVQNSTLSKVEMVDEGVQNYQPLEDRSMQAARDTSSKGNQKSVSRGSRGAQVTQKSYKDESIQRGVSQRNESVQFSEKVEYGEFNEEMAPSQEQVIFEEEEPEVERANLKEEVRDELVLPKQQINSYQEQLEQRIRDKELELNKIKRKIQTKEKLNQDRQAKLMNPQFRVEPGKLYNRGESKSSEPMNSLEQEDDRIEQVPGGILRKEPQLVAQEPEEAGKTIEEIEVLDDEGEGQKIIVEFDNKEDISRRSDDDEIEGILEMHEDEILFDEEDQREGHVEDISEEISPKLKQIGKKPVVREEVEASDGKEGSTKLYSSIRPKNARKPQGYNPGIGVQKGEMEKSYGEIESSIDEHPIYPNNANIRSDMSGTIEEVHPVNRTTESAQPSTSHLRDKIRQRVVVPQRPRRNIPEDGNPDGFARHKFAPEDKSAEKNTTHQRRSSLLLAGKSQFVEERLAQKKITKGSPLKTAKKWEYENEDKNISESGQEEVPNGRVRNTHLIMPFETDKEETEFNINHQHREKQSQMKIVRSHRAVPSPEKKYPRGESNPLIVEMEPHRVPIKPRLNDGFGSDDFSGQGSIEPSGLDSEPDEMSRHKNNMILGQMLSRPQNEDLSKYYREEGGRRSQSKGKKGRLSETEKIYLQHFGK